MSDCTHDCSSCGENCAERQGESPFQIKPLREGCRVGKVYGVVSGKGGVGKSMVTSQLAVTMQRRGHNVAVLDADITGPSIPKAFGIHGRAAATEDAILPVITGTGIQLMSVNLLLEHETDPVIWRGPVIGGVVQQFWGDVLWQDVDYMFVDMPPGTGDVALNVFQTLPVDGVIIVASPQELVSMGADKQVASGQIVEIPVTIGNNDGKNAYNAYDMTFSFDPTILALNMEATNIEGYRVIPGSGTVRIVRYGKAAELGEALTLSFVATGQGKSDVKVTEAYVDTNANAIEFDAPAAAILDDTAVITVNGYTVTLPDDFTRTDAEGSVIEAGGKLTFVPKDPNYDYTVTVTVGGVEVPPVIGEDGTYTVSNVNGNVVVTSTKTPKTFTVAQGENTTGAATATYMEDYTFKLTPVDGYTYNMTVTIGGKDYTGFKAQGNDDGTTTYTIPGADVTGDIVINSNKQVKQPETFTVTFDGTGAGEANGESSVKENTNYTFTVAKQENFEYTITATMGGKAVTVTEGANNTYTIANVTGNLVITIEKKSTLTMEVTVSKYVEMDNKTVFLVTVTGTPEEGKAFAYGDNVMYKTTAYGQNVYSWLVIVDKNETFDQATAEAKITQASATAEEVTQSYDVNETGLVDINDAQLTYDIYSGKYTDFEKVSVRKFLRADVTKDKVVNSADAVAIIANSK